MKPHAFVAMPFGTKPGPDGKLINFNSVYTDYIKPALESAGLEVLRADEEMRPGNIRTDMFQELLLADLVVADLTLDNPNVWYELGVRHALRARGVVLVSGAKVKAFDVYTDRRLSYTLKKGVPDPARLKKDRDALTKMVKATMESWHGRRISPVYHLMPNLKEPDWKSLRIGEVREFWEQHDAWEQNIEEARKKKNVGDILILAEEAPVAAFRADAWIRAGIALRKAESFDFALEQLKRGLKIQPDSLKGEQEMGMCLQRLAAMGRPGYSLGRARQHYRNILKKHPKDSETWALLGRVDKDAWTASWRQDGLTLKQMRYEAEQEDALLRAAIYSYTEGYRNDPAHYYPGINALTLMHLYQHLTKDTRYRADIADMASAVRFAAKYEQDESQRFWAAATIGDLEVLVGTPGKVRAAYKEAIAKSDKDWFALASCCAQLELLRDLGFRPKAVKAGLDTFDRALKKAAKPEQWEPRHVFLFSGHMIDAPGRPKPRFPAKKENIAAQEIAKKLDQHGAGPADLALTQGACGGDILFTEACLNRGVRVHWLQPFQEPEFIQNSVIRGGEAWRPRYMSARKKLAAPIRNTFDALGDPPKNAGEDYPYERCNLWLLYTALSYGEDKVQFICLWNGGGGDGRGGTAHMYNEVKRRTGQVDWIDSRKF